jgi:GDPmannose 4,6-dehydratase
MLQQKEADDYVIASGEQHSVKEFAELAARRLGIELRWLGGGVDEVGVAARVDPKWSDFLKEGSTLIRVDPRYFRPTEVEELLGDPSKAKEKLRWSPGVSFEQLVHEMIDADLAIARRDALIKSNGFATFNYYE